MRRLDRTRMLIDRRQLTEEGLPGEQIGQFLGVQGELLVCRPVGPDRRPEVFKRGTGSLQVMQLRLMQRGRELAAAPDGLLDLAEGGVEGQDYLILLAASDRARVVERAGKKFGPRKAVLHEQIMNPLQLGLFRANLVTDGVRHDDLLYLGNFLAKHVLEPLVGLHDPVEVQADLRAEGRLSEEVVVGQVVAGVERQSGIDDLALRRRLDLAGTQERHGKQPYEIEIPAKGFVRELVRERAAGSRFAVGGTVLDPGQYLV